MSSQTNAHDERMLAHLSSFAERRESEVLRALRERTAELPDARMQISVEQGRLMALLVGAMGARRTLEVGTFTGYSALCVAEALPPDGRLVACDVSEEWTSIGREYWRRAGVEERIDLRIGPALETLDALLAAGEAGTYDFAFVDADKRPYPDYFTRCLELLRPGGVLAFDNMFWGGTVYADSQPSEAARVLRGLTETLAEDPRVQPALVPIGDGLLLARKA